MAKDKQETNKIHSQNKHKQSKNKEKTLNLG